MPILLPQTFFLEVGINVLQNKKGSWCAIHQKPPAQTISIKHFNPSTHDFFFKQMFHTTLTGPKMYFLCTIQQLL